MISSTADAKDAGVGPQTAGLRSAAGEGSVATFTEMDLRSALEGADSAATCLGLAMMAEKQGFHALHTQSLTQAVAMDRHCLNAMVALAAKAHEGGDLLSAFAYLEEAAREGLLPIQLESFHRELLERFKGDPRLGEYLSATGRLGIALCAKPLSIVLVTNLFPPQELGGYGRMMWEFARGLIARGHHVRILTSDVVEFAHQDPTPEEQRMELHVMRSLKLLGTWTNGRLVVLEDRSEILRRLRDNAARLNTAVTKSGADLVLAGNIDLMGLQVLDPAFRKNIPVLHALANALPGYEPQSQPRNSSYWVAPCSHWNGAAFRAAGFEPARVETLYPGARIDRFFRFFLPDTRRLRLCYASLVMPYKGVDTLVHALAHLHAAGIPFTAEIAGHAPDQAFFKVLEEFVQARGMQDKVSFTGYLNRDQLGALFARSNTLVFPSRFDEPFGISQVEALASGLVVVSSGTGGAKEIIRDELDGLLFPAGDDRDLARKLARLATEKDLMARLQRQGQNRSKTFSVDIAVAKIESLATEMINEAGACASTSREPAAATA